MKTLLVAVVAALSLSAAAPAQDHPMDSLSGGEIRRAVKILQNQHLVDPSSRFP